MKTHLFLIALFLLSNVPEIFATENKWADDVYCERAIRLDRGTDVVSQLKDWKRGQVGEKNASLMLEGDLATYRIHLKKVALGIEVSMNLSTTKAIAKTALLPTLATTQFAFKKKGEEGTIQRWNFEVSLSGTGSEYKDKEIKRVGVTCGYLEGSASQYTESCEKFLDGKPYVYNRKLDPHICYARRRGNPGARMVMNAKGSNMSIARDNMRTKMCDKKIEFRDYFIVCRKDKRE